VNKDPHGSWMIVVRLTNPSETGALMDHTEYGEIAKS
jgi:glycine cleavage system H lipoate-binding protein